jgi:membrane protein involved in colicin uptake
VRKNKRKLYHQNKPSFPILAAAVVIDAPAAPKVQSMIDAFTAERDALRAAAEAKRQAAEARRAEIEAERKAKAEAHERRKREIEELQQRRA